MRCKSACLAVRSGSRLATSVVLLTLTLAIGDVSSAVTRPNVLWIIAEDMGPELASYGTTEVKTPILDSMARRGVLYENAFTVTPVCSTSRSSFMTGMYAFTIDAHNHRSHRDGSNPLPHGVRMLCDWLRPAGYSTANIRKLTDDPQLNKLHKGTGKTDWNFAYPADQRPFDTDDWQQLKSHQPFYAQVNFSETHRGTAWNTSHQHIDSTADPARVQIPPYYPDHPVTRAVWAQYLNTVMAVDKKVGFILDLLKRDGLEKKTIVVFMGDHGRAMPRAKQWPYDSGLHIPLIILWPEGNPDLPPPDGYERGSRNSQLVESIDITASTLDWAGVPKPAKMQGRVFLGNRPESTRQYAFGGRDRGDETVFHIRTVRDAQFRYLRNRFPDRPFLQLNRYKETQYPIIGLMRYLHGRGELTGPPAQLMATHRPKEELYDVKADPWEINNLAGSPEFADVQRRLSTALDDWIDRIDDQGRMPEDPSIAASSEETMRQNYAQRLNDRPNDWFRSHPALGPYRVDTLSLDN